MKKNKTWFLILFSVFSVTVFTAAISLKDRVEVSPGDAQSDQNSGQTMSPSDSDLVSPMSNGDDEIVASTQGDYYFSMPSNWYAEKNTEANTTVYPDYAPQSGAAPDCKIEISQIATSSLLSSLNNADSARSLDRWVTAYLHADPTASVEESSRVQLQVGSNPAIEWFGSLNGVTTTLVYVAMPNNVLELAPSSLAPAGDSDTDGSGDGDGTGDDGSDDCGLALQALIANLNFGAYEP
jgi:hypothetical protein